ncbi:MAG: peptide chain release factor N(5)-glutamine methyltransferase [Alphaproteobacteria bacterium]|nr:peptide chain release factor N(5)-glutamine methyltransferase [Alphaproteobacteria bacterium]
MKHSSNSLISQALEYLRKNNVDTYVFEIKIMLADLLNMEVSQIKISDLEVSDDNKKQFWQMIEKRKNHFPVDKIIGHRGFYKYNFIVDTNVLSPRPDTEILLEETLKICDKTQVQNILELGVGSGCVITSVLAEKDIMGVGVDISSAALSIAQQNAQNLGVEGRLRFIHGDWFSSDFTLLFTNKFDLIVSNPPYIPTGEIGKLDAEVKDYDPIVALDGGVDGLDAYRQIATISPKLLNNNGYIVLEVGENQAEDVINIFEYNKFKLYKIVQDLSGIKRCVILKK